MDYCLMIDGARSSFWMGTSWLCGVVAPGVLTGCCYRRLGWLRRGRTFPALARL